MQDYDTLSMEQLVDELQILVKTTRKCQLRIMLKKLKGILAKYNHFIEEKGGIS
jgi:hypothetical protein